MSHLNDNFDITNSNLLGDEFANLGGDEYSNAHGKKIKAFFKKEKDKIKKAGDSIKKGIKNEGAKIKKVAKKLKDKVGAVGKKFRNKFRSILRKGVLFNIKRNIHGTAVSLYPAIAPAADITKRKYKKSYVDKSKKIYAELLTKWKDLGGNEADMKTAITQGSTKGFLKNPYKSMSGNNSDDFYNYASYIEEYFGADGDTDTQDDNTAPDTSPTTDTTTPSTDDTTTEVPDATETVKAHKGFFAWLLSLFHKHKATENPYEDNTPNAATFTKDTKADAGNQPAPAEAKNDVITHIEDTAKVDDAGGKTDTEKTTSSDLDETNLDENTGLAKDSVEAAADDKIWGLSKPVFWSGVAVVSLVGILITVHLIKGGKKVSAPTIV